MLFESGMSAVSYHHFNYMLRNSLDEYNSTFAFELIKYYFKLPDSDIANMSTIHMLIRFHFTFDDIHNDEDFGIVIIKCSYQQIRIRAKRLNSVTK